MKSRHIIATPEATNADIVMAEILGWPDSAPVGGTLFSEVGMFGIFPLLILVVIAFNVVVFAGGMVSVEGMQDKFDVVIANVPMMSGDVWQLTLGNLFVIASLIFLFIEIAKATRTDTSSIINHGLSLVVFIVCLLEFIMIGGFGNSTFFFITCMTLLDVIAGFTVTISTARRDLGVGEGIFGA